MGNQSSNSNFSPVPSYSSLSWASPSSSPTSATPSNLKSNSISISHLKSSSFFTHPAYGHGRGPGHDATTLQCSAPSSRSADSSFSNLHSTRPAVSSHCSSSSSSSSVASRFQVPSIGRLLSFSFLSTAYAQPSSDSSSSSASSSNSSSPISSIPATPERECPACSGRPDTVAANTPNTPTTSASDSSPSSSSSSSSSPPSSQCPPCYSYQHSSCPLNRAELGRASWAYLHTLAAYYPISPSLKQQQEMSDFITTYSRLYPCGYCADRTNDEIVRNPIRVASRKEFGIWMCELHNEVNERLNKPIFDCSLVEQRWRHGMQPPGQCD